jgi:hypothetical protein
MVGMVGRVVPAVVLFVSYFTGRPRRDVIVVLSHGAQGALASLKAARHLGDQDDA